MPIQSPIYNLSLLLIHTAFQVVKRKDALIACVDFILFVIRLVQLCNCYIIAKFCSRSARPNPKL